MRKSNKKWYPISIGSQFKLQRGRENKSTVEAGGITPFVSAKKSDNGYRMFVDNPSTKINGNTLSLNNNGDGGAGFGYYQPYEYTVDVNTTALVPLSNVPMEKFVGLFYVGSFTWMHDFFGNARTLSNKRAEITKIMLPVTKDKKPDYQYMSKYIEDKYQALSGRYRTYIKKCISELGEYIEIQPLNKTQWSPFLIADVFNIFSGKRLVASDSTPGKRPFIGALDNSNGIARFVSDKNSSLDRNVLGVNYDGNGMVIGFYHPYECIFSDSVKRFHLKNHEDNAYILLFMKVVILQQKSKFGYLYKFNAERMEHTKIMLPVDSEGNIDYEYMEQYAKNMMLKKYKQYLSFLNAKEKDNSNMKGQ